MFSRISNVPALLCILTGIAYLLCLLSAHGWAGELAVHWRLHMAGGAALLAIVFVGMRRFRPALWMFAFTLGFAAPAIKLFAPLPPAPGAVRDRLTLLHFNIYYENEDFAKAVPWILAQDADLVLLHEVSAARAGELEALKERYPWSRIDINPQRAALGMAVFSKLPVLSYHRQPTMQKKQNHYSFLTLSLPSGATLHFYEIHPPPPMSAALMTQRKHELALIAQTLAQDTAPYRVLMGDLNNTVYSPLFHTILMQGRLHHAQHGWRLSGTWPMMFPSMLRIGIDHLLASHAIRVESRELGPYLGSDHLPVLYRLTLHETTL